MSVRLTVDRAAWLAHVAQQVEAYGNGLIPVVKGNGYGFGRTELLEQVRLHTPSALVAVGTLEEAPQGRALVLTPTVVAPARTDLVLTVGHTDHLAALATWQGSVTVKLQSTMRRYGVGAADLATLLARTEAQGLEVTALSLHLPLAGDDTERRLEIDEWVRHLDALGLDHELWISHLAPEAYHELCSAHPERTFRIRVGTRLWLGVPKGPFVHLSADVLQVTRVQAGDVGGYRATPVPSDGHLVSIGAGTSNGVAPLEGLPPDRNSPFHFARTRLALVEPPHMHTSMVFVPDGQPCPAVGDRVDVQRPLITTHPDHIVWSQA